MADFLLKVDENSTMKNERILPQNVTNRGTDCEKGTPEEMPLKLPLILGITLPICRYKCLYRFTFAFYNDDTIFQSSLFQIVRKVE